MSFAQPLLTGGCQASLQQASRPLRLAASRPATWLHVARAAARGGGHGDPPGNGNPPPPSALSRVQTWRPWTKAPLQAPAGQRPSRPAPQQGSSWQQAKPAHATPHTFSSERLIEIAQQAQNSSDLTEGMIEEAKEVCPSWIDAEQEQLDEMTWLIAEGRRLAEEIRRRAHTPSQIPRETIVRTVAVIQVCMAWSKAANEQIKQKLQLE